MYGWRLKRGKDQANQLTVAGKFKSPDMQVANHKQRIHEFRILTNFAYSMSLAFHQSILEYDEV